jgi:hypothetical protein
MKMEKRIYKNNLPKDKEVVKTNVRIEDNNLITEVYFKDEYLPKFGDIVRLWEFKDNNDILRDYMICIWPKDKNADIYDGSFFDIANINRVGELSFKCNNSSIKSLTIIPATTYDKLELTKALQKCNIAWDSSNKELKPLFNDGDFLYNIKDSSVVIFKSINAIGNVVAYGGSFAIDNCCIKESTWDNIENYRLATAEEIAQFNANLLAYDEIWDSAKRCFLKAFKPQDGDFLVSSRNRVFILDTSGNTAGFFGCYAGEFTTGETRTTPASGWTPKEDCRYANEVEIKEFLSKIEEEHSKVWDSSTKSFKNWEPRYQEKYYYIDIFGDIHLTYNHNNIINPKGNCFKTIESARMYANRMKNVFKDR